MPYISEAVHVRRIENAVRRILARSGLKPEAVKDLASQYHGSAQTLFITNAELRDLFAAVAKIDKARERTPHGPAKRNRGATSRHG
jgi:hypothetical protein